jgi:hypothetical protein
MGLIIRHRVGKGYFYQLDAAKEKTHETCNKDFNPAVWTSGHICSSRRSAGSRPGRRPHICVPTSTTTARQIRSTATEDSIAVNRMTELIARSLK